MGNILHFRRKDTLANFLKRDLSVAEQEGVETYAKNKLLGILAYLPGDIPRAQSDATALERSCNEYLSKQVTLPYCWGAVALHELLQGNKQGYAWLMNMADDSEAGKNIAGRILNVIPPVDEKIHQEYVDKIAEPI